MNEEQKTADKNLSNIANKDKESNLDKIRWIVRERGYKKINDTIIDMQTANTILKALSSLKKENKEKYLKIIEEDAGKAGRIAWKLIEKAK